MKEKAFQLFIEAWNSVKQGNFFDESTNNTFDYMIKSLWKTDYQDTIKKDILKHLPTIFEKSKDFQDPPPVFYILISLKDNAVVKELQGLIVLDWIKSGASEESTFHVLNFIETFSEKQIPIAAFVNTIINHITPTMNRDMVEAMSNMITVQHPEFMGNFLKKFLSMPDKTLLKEYVRIGGRKAFLQLTQIASPTELNTIFKEFKK